MPLFRLVIADDHRILRDGVRQLLHTEPGYEVVGEAGTAAEALRLVRELAPDVLLLDLALPDESGIAVLRALSGSPARTRTILLTAAAEREQVVEALLLGARGLVLKESATALLFRCLQAVLAGEYWVGHDRMSDILEVLRRYCEPAPAPPAWTLTARELNIVAAIVAGATNREIATQLLISEQTVKNHMSHIFDKVGVSNRLELALFAIHHRLLERRHPLAQRPAPHDTPGGTAAFHARG